MDNRALTLIFAIIIVGFSLTMTRVNSLPVLVPAGTPKDAIEMMIQIPQWHCLRYRKFELVRRCRTFKHGLRRP